MATPWTGSVLFSLPDEAHVPMSWVRSEILDPLEEDADRYAVLYATARYWAAVITGALPVPFRTGGGSFHGSGTDTPTQEDMSTYEPKRFSVGIRGLNRVTVFTRRDSPSWYLEWWAYGADGKRERVIRSLATITGSQVTDEGEARRLATSTSHTIKAMEAARINAELNDPRDPIGHRVLENFYGPQAAQRAPAPLPNQEYGGRPEEKPPLPEGIREKGRDKAFGDLVEVYAKALEMKKRKASTIRAYRASAQAFSTEIPLDTPLHECTAEWFHEATMEIAPDFVAGTLNGYTKKICTLFRYANEKGWTDGNLLSDYSPTEVGESRFDSGKYYRDGEEEKILAEMAKTNPVEAFIGYAVLDSGPRPSEVACMRPNWFKLRKVGEREVLEMHVPKHVRKAGPAHTALIRTPEAVQLWKDHVRPILDEKGFLGNGPDRASDSAAIQISRPASDAFNEAEARIGIQHITGRSLYSLKHRYCTRCIEAGRVDLASEGAGVDEKTIRKYYNVSERTNSAKEVLEILG